MLNRRNALYASSIQSGMIVSTFSCLSCDMRALKIPRWLEVSAPFIAINEILLLCYASSNTLSEYSTILLSQDGKIEFLYCIFDVVCITELEVHFTLVCAFKKCSAYRSRIVLLIQCFWLF